MFGLQTRRNICLTISVDITECTVFLVNDMIKREKKNVEECEVSVWLCSEYHPAVLYHIIAAVHIKYTDFTKCAEHNSFTFQVQRTNLISTIFQTDCLWKCQLTSCDLQTCKDKYIIL